MNNDSDNRRTRMDKECNHCGGSLTMVGTLIGGVGQYCDVHCIVQAEDIPPTTCDRCGGEISGGRPVQTECEGDASSVADYEWVGSDCWEKFYQPPDEQETSVGDEEAGRHE